jgi:quinolinate synthase
MPTSTSPRLRREKVLFFPDQHLGRNTGYKMGIPLEDMVVWDYDMPMGGLSAEQIRGAKMILWKGFCSVHQMFKPEQIENFRQEFPEGKVISHPEASFEVCQMSDYVGSTEYIIKTITEAEPGTQWLVGTELVQFMSPMVCMCSTMFRIDPQHLAWVLENLVEGNVVNQISVAPDVADNARIALQRMLDI